EEEEKEESEKKISKEASEMGSNSDPPGYAAIKDDVESDLESTARGEPKCKEMEDTCVACGEFCPSNKMEKLESEFWNHTMIGTNHVGYTDRFHKLDKLVPHLSVILKAGILTDEAVYCGTLTRSSEKRKEVEETSKQGGSWKDNKKAKVGKGFVATAPPRNENVGSYSKCAKCSAYHPEGGLFEALQDPNVVTGTFSLNNHFATVLFDSGADFSFISTKFAPLLNVKPNILSPEYVIEVANGRKKKLIGLSMAAN
ncbi:reverse transcriptase domain-containing protein, partial [Tanacetum coccineum]